MNRTARILIISNGPLCRNPRVLKEASALGSAGHDVTVLTLRNHAPSEPVDRLLLADAPFRRITVDILTGFETPRAVILWRRAVTWAARRFGPRIGLRCIRSLGPSGALLQKARRSGADLVITHNEVPHWVGTRLIADGWRVCADIEDWHSEDLLPEHRINRPIRVLRQVERTLLNRAACVTTTSEALAGALHARYGGRRPEVLTNSFPLQPLAPVADDGATPAFFWFSQTLGPGRGLEEFMRAWTLTTHPSRVVLLGTPTAGYDRELLAFLPEHRRKLVEFLPLVSPDDLPALIARHHIGLALELPDIPSRDLTITNKILQYLNAGLAVVASDTAGQREVLAREPEAGVIVNTRDTRAFSASLESLLADRTALARRRRAARTLAERCYCWEIEAPRRLAMINRVLGDSP